MPLRTRVFSIFHTVFHSFTKLFYNPFENPKKLFKKYFIFMPRFLEIPHGWRVFTVKASSLQIVYKFCQADCLNRKKAEKSRLLHLFNRVFHNFCIKFFKPRFLTKNSSFRHFSKFAFVQNDDYLFFIFRCRSSGILISVSVSRIFLTSFRRTDFFGFFFCGRKIKIASSKTSFLISFITTTFLFTPLIIVFSPFFSLYK